MRIVLVSGEDPGWGGIGTYTGVLGRALSELGHDVILVLRGWEEPGEETLDGLPVHRVPVAEPSWRRGSTTAVERLYETREAVLFSRGVARIIRRLSPDAVEMPEFGAPALLSALGPARRPGRPRVVVRLHAPGFLAARLAGQRPGLDARARELLEALATRSAHCVTSPSHALARLVRGRWRLPAARLAVIPNPIDESTFTPEGAGAAAPPPPGPVPGRILIVGRVERAKGHDILLEALPAIRARVPAAHVEAIGEDGGLAESLRARARALGMADAFSLLGAHPRAALPAAYRGAAVCVVPSRFEAFSYTAVEAMACGRPVVAARAGALPEVVEEDRSGRLVAPGDPGALADAVTALLGDPERAAALGAEARRSAVARFASATVAAQMAEIYAGRR